MVVLKFPFFHFGPVWKHATALQLTLFLQVNCKWSHLERLDSCKYIESATFNTLPIQLYLHYNSFGVWLDIGSTLQVENFVASGAALSCSRK